VQFSEPLPAVAAQHESLGANIRFGAATVRERSLVNFG
jgi:hypothetical protein